MKTIEKTLTVLLIVFSTSLSYAAINENKVQLREKQDGIVQLLYKSSDSEKVEITILNQKGKVVLSEKVKNENGFMRNYNFNKFESGTYTFQISDESGQIKKKLYFGKKSPVALVKGENNKHRLIYDSKIETDVQVIFLDRRGKTILKDQFVSIDGFSKTYIVDRKSTSAHKLRFITENEVMDFEL